MVLLRDDGGAAAGGAPALPRRLHVDRMRTPAQRRRYVLRPTRPLEALHLALHVEKAAPEPKSYAVTVHAVAGGYPVPRPRGWSLSTTLGLPYVYLPAAEQPQWVALPPWPCSGPVDEVVIEVHRWRRDVPLAHQVLGRAALDLGTVRTSHGPHREVLLADLGPDHD